MKQAILFIIACPRQKRRALLREFTSWFEVAGIVAAVMLIFLALPGRQAHRQSYISGTAALERTLEQIRAKEIVVEPVNLWQTSLTVADLRSDGGGRIFRSSRGASHLAAATSTETKITQLDGSEMRSGTRPKIGAIDKPILLVANQSENLVGVRPGLTKGKGQEGEFYIAPPLFRLTAAHSAAGEGTKLRPGGLNR